MKYLTFIRHSESYREEGPPPALLEAMGEFVQASLADGTLVETGGLLPSKDGLRVRLEDGKITVSDGPFSESKEVIGGYAVIEAKDREEAIELTKRFLAVHGDAWDIECEVRPLDGDMEFGPDA